jgi:hypothetical protein
MPAAPEAFARLEETLIDAAQQLAMIDVTIGVEMRRDGRVCSVPIFYAVGIFPKADGGSEVRRTVFAYGETALGALSKMQALARKIVSDGAQAAQVTA